jgi:hypothetical protein
MVSFPYLKQNKDSKVTSHQNASETLRSTEYKTNLTKSYKKSLKEIAFIRSQSVRNSHKVQPNLKNSCINKPLIGRLQGALNVPLAPRDILEPTACTALVTWYVNFHKGDFNCSVTAVKHYNWSRGNTKPCRSAAGQTSDSHRGNPGPIPAGQRGNGQRFTDFFGFLLLSVISPLLRTHIAVP